MDTSTDIHCAHVPSESQLATPVFTDDRKKINRSLSEKDKQTLVESLRFAQMDARQTTIKIAHTKTCTWILENSLYQDWMDIQKLEQHHGFFWIRGKAGTGKSTLMKFIWGDVRKRMENHIVLSFFFNARGGELEKSTIGAYRSLLVQLFGCLPSLRSVFDSLDFSTLNISLYRGWNVQSLEILLLQAISGLGTLPVVCFIDALDECEEELVRDMIQFLEQISDMAVAKGIRFQVCFSSRHYPHITISHGLELVLEGQEGHTHDIANYVKTELKVGNSMIADQIRTELQRKASGIFMWVVLVVRMLNRESDRGQVQELWKKLQDIPNDLHQLFYNILTRDSLNQDRFVLCIQWILYAKHPLSPEQLHHAILSGIDPDGMAKIDYGNTTEDITRLFVLNSSKGLAEITVSKNPTVQFIHESVRDFFLKRNALDKILPEFSSNLQGQDNDRLKHCCLNYIKMVVASPSKYLHDHGHENSRHPLYTHQSRERSQGKAAKKIMPATQMAPFLEYSTLNVFSHANSAEGSGISQADFLRVFPLLQWVKLYNMCLREDKDRYAESVSLLYVLAEFDMPNLMMALGSIGQCIEVEDERYGCPLLAAVARRSESALRLCLDSIEVRQRCRDSDTAAVAKRLIQHAVHHWFYPSHDFDHRQREGFLIAIAEIGHEELFELLTVSKHIDIDATDSRGRTALWLASQKGWSQAVSSLLDVKPATIDVKDVYGGAPLYAASARGNHKIAALLLNNGAIVNAQGGKYGNALQAASAAGYYQTAALLLDNGANVNAQGGIYGNALQAALTNYYAEVAGLLLQKGAIETHQWSHHYLLRRIREQIPSSANPTPQPPQTPTNPLQTPINALPSPSEQPAPQHPETACSHGHHPNRLELRNKPGRSTNTLKPLDKKSSVKDQAWTYRGGCMVG
jgi:ankyrin repeat protein